MVTTIHIVHNVYLFFCYVWTIKEISFLNVWRWWFKLTTYQQGKLFFLTCWVIKSEWKAKENKLNYQEIDTEEAIIDISPHPNLPNKRRKYKKKTSGSEGCIIEDWDATGTKRKLLIKRRVYKYDEGWNGRASGWIYYTRTLFSYMLFAHWKNWYWKIEENLINFLCN